jgi:hypothetical protein
MERRKNSKIFTEPERYATKHPLFNLQDRYVLAPHTLGRRGKVAIFFHLLHCPFCRRTQKKLRASPDEWLAIWRSPDPRVK